MQGLGVCRCFRYHKGTDFQANHNARFSLTLRQKVVLDTTKVQIFKQITTTLLRGSLSSKLFQIPQRYRFSSKSQHVIYIINLEECCFRYHKGTDFQANHNKKHIMIMKQQLFQIPQRYRFSSKSQLEQTLYFTEHRCFRYHKGTDFQANHNVKYLRYHHKNVVLDTTKVQIFKQITTKKEVEDKGREVVLDTTKVQIFKQITTGFLGSSLLSGCFRYHKGTDFQANHNQDDEFKTEKNVVLDTTKVQIFKQITTQ